MHKRSESIAMIRPYSVVENDGFRYMLNILEPSYSVQTDEQRDDPKTLQWSKMKHCCVLTVSGQGVTITCHYVMTGSNLKCVVDQSYAG